MEKVNHFAHGHCINAIGHKNRVSTIQRYAHYEYVNNPINKDAFDIGLLNSLCECDVNRIRIKAKKRKKKY